MRMLKINWGSINTAGDAALNSLSRLPFTWHGAGALILGVLLAKWFWILFAPHATFTAMAPERAASLETGRLFGVVATTDTGNQGVALPNVKLLGVFTATANRKGFAILKLDDKRQLGVAEGEEVAAGTTLLSVQADYVQLEHAGVQQKVNLENKYLPPATSKGIQPAYGAAASQANTDALSSEMQKGLRQLHR
jgi:hypothetical protein